MDRAELIGKLGPVPPQYAYRETIDFRLWVSQASSILCVTEVEKWDGHDPEKIPCPDHTRMAYELAQAGAPDRKHGSQT